MPLIATRGAATVFGYRDTWFKPADPGEEVFTIHGSHTWTVPLGVTSVCVVCIGGGGAGNQGGTEQSGGGGGGGLGWKNDIAVTPGQNITVVVGKGGQGNNTGTTSGESGGDSYFDTVSVCKGGGGAGGQQTGAAAGGTYTGDGGGNGGAGGEITGAETAGGGGGAGGYSGNGGAGGGTVSSGGANGSGGGGGGGGRGGGNDFAGSGGGTGIFGEGSNGSGAAVAAANNLNTAGGGSGAGGAVGSDTTHYPPTGGSSYGGGGGAAYTSYENGSGGHGVVRIIWGEGRAFPSTNVNYTDSITLPLYLERGHSVSGDTAANIMMPYWETESGARTTQAWAACHNRTSSVPTITGWSVDASYTTDDYAYVFTEAGSATENDYAAFSASSDNSIATFAQMNYNDYDKTAFQSTTSATSDTVPTMTPDADYFLVIMAICDNGTYVTSVTNPSHTMVEFMRYGDDGGAGSGRVSIWVSKDIIPAGTATGVSTINVTGTDGFSSIGYAMKKNVV